MSGVASSGVGEVLRVFLWLGLTSFGGPVAHIGYFRRELVERRAWVTEAEFAAWVGLCQFLPGPASTQMAFSLGMRRAGLGGALAALLAFTGPSFLLMAGFGIWIGAREGGDAAGWIHGLKLVAVAVVAHGVLGMARRLWTDVGRVAIGVAVGAVALATEAGWVQPVAILAAGCVGTWVCRGATPGGIGSVPYGRGVGWVCAAGFGLLAVGMPVVLRLWEVPGLVRVAGTFAEAGAWVFGGGHVVLPLLEGAVTGPGWVSRDEFLAGYGAAQAVPGPMFTLAAFLGMRLPGAMGGWPGALVGTLSIFLPGLLAIAGVLPFWDAWVRREGMARAVAGVNAGVVGLLGAALYDPVCREGVRDWRDGLVALVGVGCLMTGRVPVLAVVVGCVLAGGLWR